MESAPDNAVTEMPLPLELLSVLVLVKMMAKA